MSPADTYPGVHYGDYLQLDKILDAQHLISGEGQKTPAHDEHLFIVVHQTHELWFKQILHELDYVSGAFSRDSRETHDLFRVVHRLRRVVQVLALLVGHVKILETMGPLDFLEFRDLLAPASGFQSVQFRVIEHRLGLVRNQRSLPHPRFFSDHFRRDEADLLRRSQQGPSIAQLVERWLERVSDRQADLPKFLDAYRQAVHRHFDEGLREAELTSADDPAAADSIAKEHRRKLDAFDTIFRPDVHAELVDRGKSRLSYKAFIGALMITAYR